MKISTKEKKLRIIAVGSKDWCWWTLKNQIDKIMIVDNDNRFR